jgi:membrane-bound lytic murein transglycosylase B
MKIWTRAALIYTAACMLIPFPAIADYSEHPDAQIFIDKMVNDHKSDRAHVISLMQNASKKQSIIDAMNRPAEKVKSWADYRNIFIQERRIDQGVKFWAENQSSLARASKKYSVAPEVIVAIIGVETSYGRNKGSYRVIDALSTLAFDYPRRSAFFTRQLENFLLLAREQNQDPLALMGSYAGAMGYGQFIPSSYRSYAVDFDGDGFSDIWNNTADAIGSVANYFSRHDWKMDGEVVVRAHFDKDSDLSLANKLKLDKNISDLGSLGFSPIQALPADVKALPVLLEGPNGNEFWLGLHNFYVITRYNHSHLYAMAVHELSQLILERAGKNKM